MKGVDISHYQDGLTIKQIRDSGNEFAIFKLTEGTGYVDPSAFGFYKEAYELGFPVGCYCYSHAVNTQQAMAEAHYLLDQLNGFPMPCGVFLDIEAPEQLALSHDEMKNVVLGWAAAVMGRGYLAGFYGSAANLWAILSPNELPNGCMAWVAKWSNTPPDLPCDLWQNSDNGHVEGYDGPVDTDEARSTLFKTLVNRGFPQREDAEGEEELAPDACPIDGGCGGAHFDFGDAIRYLKRGLAVAREGWNGKGQYIKLAQNIQFETLNGQEYKPEHDAIGNRAIAFFGTSGIQMGWLASQADMLAEDWHIVDE